jgi:hypothetical protein
MRAKPVPWRRAFAPCVSALALFTSACGDAAPGSYGGGVDAGAEGDACVNGEDLAILDDHLNEVVDAALTCLWDCHTEADPVACAAECMSDTVGLSVDCSACWAEYGVCVSEQCQESCGLEAPEGECSACTAEHCRPPFEDCAGMPMP